MKINSRRKGDGLCADHDRALSEDRSFPGFVASLKPRRIDCVWGWWVDEEFMCRSQGERN